MKHLNINFLFSAALLMVIMTIADTNYVMAAAKPLDRIAVVVNDDIVMESQVKKRIIDVTGKLKAQNIEMPPSDILLREVLEMLIMESIQLQIGERVGVRVDDNTLNQALENIAQQNGFTLDEFRQALENDGISYSDTRKQIHKEMIISRVRDGRVGSRIQITDQEVENYINSEAGKAQLQAEYQLGHILISLSDTASATEIIDTESKTNKVYEQLLNGSDFTALAKKYSAGPDAAKGGDMGWRKHSQLPSLFINVVASMQIGDISRPIKAGNGFHIIKILGKTGGDSIMIPKTHVRHILLKPSEIRTEEQTQALIIKLRNQIINGASFADIAKNNSDDNGSLAAGGDLGWMSAEELVPKFSEVMSTMAINEISQPFQTNYGWHILQVLNRQEYEMGLELKQNRAKDVIYRRKFTEEVEIWLREEREDAYVDIKLY